MAKHVDLSAVVKRVQDSVKDEGLKRTIKMGSDMTPISEDPKDYVVLPKALDWPDVTGGLLGLPFGKLTQVAGDSDTGKTSFAIAAMKAAQEQGVSVLYVETEGKTSRNNLEMAGVNPNIMLVQSGIAEKAFTSMFNLWDAFFEQYPDEKLLVVVDSWGNTLSMRDDGLDLTTDNQKPGGQAKTNRLSVNKMIARMEHHKVTVLIINYTYDNMGSVGKTNAGGKALHFFTYVGFQTKRTGWVEKQTKGETIRLGAKVRWTTYKNQAAHGMGRTWPHHVDFIIDDKGMRRDV